MRIFFFSSRRRHTRLVSDWSSDVCSSDLEFAREAALVGLAEAGGRETARPAMPALKDESVAVRVAAARTIAAAGDPASSTVLIRRVEQEPDEGVQAELLDRKSTRLNSSH